MVQQIKKLTSFLVLILIPTVSAATIIQYQDIVTPPLEPFPYGESIIISGKFKDVKSGGVSLSDWMDLDAVEATYTVSGAEKKVTGVVNKNSGEWQAVLQPLPATSYVSIQFLFSGPINDKKSAEIVDKLYLDSQFQKAVDTLFANATNKSLEETKKYKDDFIASIKKIIQGLIPSFFKIDEGKSFADRIGLDTMLSLVTSLANMRTNIKELAKIEQFKTLKITDKSSPAEVYAALQQIDVTKLTDGEKETVDQFEKKYDTTKKGLQQTVQVLISVQSSVTASALVKDIQKYCGIDYAVVYSKKINELREFITVNIYYGAVNDSPTNEESKHYPVWNYLRDRLSLTVGWNIGVLSSNPNSNIKGNEAYLYGIGFRINKYFRIDTGNILYRSETNGGMDKAFFAGMSLDLTAFDALKSLVSKASP